MELVIDRSKWGVGGDGGLLLNEFTGRMCCLGFMALALGFQDEDIEGIGMPDSLNCGDVDPRLDVGFGPKIVYFDDNEKTQNSTTFANDAAGINDNPNLTLPEREAKLIELFAAEGIQLSFTNEYGAVIVADEALE